MFKLVKPSFASPCAIIKKMRDPFWEYADHALDSNRTPLDRIANCRLAAEAYCKWAATGPFPEKVEGNLSRMINHLFKKGIIQEKDKALLDVIRMYASSQMHDNDSGSDKEFISQSLDLCVACLQVLKSTHAAYPPLYSKVGVFEHQAKLKLNYKELQNDSTRPAICLNGDGPFNCDQLEGLFRRYDVRAEHMHRTKQFHGNPNLWLVFGRQVWSENSLKSLNSTSEVPQSEVMWDECTLNVEPNERRFFSFEYEHIPATGIFQINNLKIAPASLGKWNIVVMGQEACLQFLCEKTLDITQKDIFSDHRHSQHPTVKAYQALSKEAC